MTDPPQLRLDLAFEKLGAREHVLSYRRGDGTGERLTLETRTFLLHDLAHFAVEQAFARPDGVYGRLARGSDYEGLTSPSPGGMDVEHVVVRLQTSWRKEQLCEDFVRLFTAPVHAANYAPAAWVDEQGLRASWDLLRQTFGKWRATPFGGEMRLEFCA